MAKIKGPLMSQTASGNYGGKIQFRTKGGKAFAHKAPDPKAINQQPASERQAAVRAAYVRLRMTWAALSEPDRQTYRDEAAASAKPITGWNLYIQKHLSGEIDMSGFKYGNGAPAPTFGSDGDLYLDVANLAFYGPKASGDWGQASELISATALSTAIADLISSGAIAAGNHTHPSGELIPNKTGFIISTATMHLDNHWADNIILMPMTGNDGSTTFTDIFGHSITAYGNARIRTGNGKWDNSSGYFDGSGDYLQSSAIEALKLGSSDFTLELWFYGTNLSDLSTTRRLMIINDGLGATEINIGIKAGKKPFFYIYYSNDYRIQITGVDALSENVWTHIAAVRHGNIFTLYVNGNSVGTVTQSNITMPTVNMNVVFGYTLLPNYPGWYEGYMQDVRLCHAARYTQNFTPASAAFPTVEYANQAIDVLSPLPSIPEPSAGNLTEAINAINTIRARFQSAGLTL